MRKASIAVGAGALIAMAAAIWLSGWFGGRPTLQVVNVDGQTVVVVPWVGGPTITVSCGRTLDIDTSGSPGQPWLVTVTSSTDHHVLLQQERSGSAELIVRGGTVLIGDPHAPSVGPAGGCAR